MRLYAITNRTLLPGTHVRGRLSGVEHGELLRLAAQWAASCVDYIQLREKDLPPEVLAGLVAEMTSVISGRAHLLVNADGADATLAAAAREAGAAGLHLPGRWTAEQVGWARTTGMVSVACHSVGEVAVARAAKADVALLSPIFPTESHAGAQSLGLAVLAEACRTAGDMPVFALGGVTAANAAACVAAGAAGVAGIRMFFDPAAWNAIRDVGASA